MNKTIHQSVGWLSNIKKWTFKKAWKYNLRWNQRSFMTPSYSLLQITRVLLEISLQHLPRDEVPVTALISCNTTPRTRTTSRLKGWHHEHITTRGIKKMLWWEKKDGLHHLWNKWDRLVVVWKYPDISRQHLGTREPLRRNAPSSYWTWEGTINLLVGWLSMIIPGLSHIFSSPQTWNSRLRATQRYQGHPSPTWGVTRACQVSH